MKKMRFILLAILAIAGTNVKAQSSDAAYPMGCWQTDDENNNYKYFVDIEMYREIDENGSCGGLNISEAETNKTLYNGDLFYSHKMLNDNNMGNGTYVFIAKSDKGKECVIWVNANKEPMVTANGELKDHPALKQKLILIPGALGGTGGEIFGMYCESEKELLDDLRFAAKQKNPKAPGFGNLQQFINAHAKLDPSKPKYAKPKGTGSINIREKANTTAAKIGELKPGETLPVVDEFNGWCLVKLDEKQKGWVSLSVVTLTNTPSATAVSPAKDPATTAAPAETICPITGNFSGYLGNKGWGEWGMFLQAEQKVGVNPKMPKRVSNGAIDLTDEEFVNEKNYNLVFVRTVSPGVYEFTLQCMVNKQLKSGKMLFKVSGDNITMTGLDAWTKQQPFHGKTIGKPNPVIQ